MANNNKTIWQQISSTLTPTVSTTQHIVNKPNQNSNSQQQLIKNLSAEEKWLKDLENRQTNYLKNQYLKVANYQMQQEFHNYSGRQIAYQDYESMEFYPIISSALTLLAEECTMPDDEGNVVTVESNNDRIKKEIEYLLYDVIDLNTNMYFWTRQTIKYGDNFVYVMGLPDIGVTDVRQQPPLQIERCEKENDGKLTVEFKRVDTNTDFNIFQMLHFRLLEDDKYLPYGSSVLNKVRRNFRQLVMAEDAMLTYRIERASERRVFKIDVGNIDDDDVTSYVQKIANTFKKQPVSKDAGKIDHRYNSLTVSEDYFIPIRNNNNATVIDTLPGATNLDDIADIEYLRNQLYTGLGIPKPFLDFDETAGEGKTMSMMDVRLAKKVNRIQKHMIAELIKLVQIHLYLKGYEEDDIMDFRLSMTNPSPQLDLLKMEVLEKRAQIYDSLVKPEQDTQIAIMSHAKAKRLIFGMSDDEITFDLEQQKVERIIGSELNKAKEEENVKSGFFNKIDKRLGIEDEKENADEENQEDMGDEDVGTDE